MPYRDELNAAYRVIENLRERLGRKSEENKVTRRKKFLEWAKNHQGNIIGVAVITGLLLVLGTCTYLDMTTGPTEDECKATFTEANVACIDRTIENNMANERCTCITTSGVSVFTTDVD